MAKARKIPLNNILATMDTQPRATINVDVVKRYAEDLADGAIFPPVIVFNEGGGSERNYLADGYHRLFAHRDCEKETILADVREGGLLEAKLFAWGANATHGFRRSRTDTTRAVEEALQDPEVEQKFSQQEIADICKVTRRTVSRIKQRLVVEEAERRAKKPDSGKVTVEDPTEDDLRPSRPAPTQEEVEAGELREALAMIKAFPYGGEDTDKLALSGDDVADLKYVAGWCSHAVLVWSKE